MPECRLTGDFAPSDCREFGVGGVTGAVYFIDYEDWLKATITPAADTFNGIEGITLASGAEGYKYELVRGGAVPSSPFTKNNAGQSGFTHTVQMFVSPANKQEIKNQWVGYTNYRRVVAIVVMDNQEVSQVYGRTTGLEVSVYDELPNDPSTGGGFTITLTTPTDTTLEVAPSDSFFNTDRDTTITALDALTTPAP